MMFMRTKRRHQPGRIGSFLQRLRKGRAKRLNRQRLDATTNSISTVEFLEDRTLLSAMNSIANFDLYDAPASIFSDYTSQDTASSQNRAFTNRTQAQEQAENPASEEVKQKHLNDLGQVDSPSNPTQFATNEAETIGTNGSNDTINDAELITGLGTGPDDEFDADVAGFLANAVQTTRGPFGEDDGSIDQANFLGLSDGEQIRIVNALIGNGPNGSGGTDTGDFDYYLVSGLQAGDQLSISVEDATQFNGLDPIVGVYSSSGSLLVQDDDSGNYLDSLLNFTAPVGGDYYIMISSYNTGFPGDPFDSASGNGVNNIGGPGDAEGTYNLTVGLNAQDIDYYAVELEAGDILGANLTGSGQTVSIYSPSETLMFESSLYLADYYPTDSPLPGDGNASGSIVAPVAGTYYIGVSGDYGLYDLQLRVFRPELESQMPGAIQTSSPPIDRSAAGPGRSSVILPRSTTTVTGSVVPVSFPRNNIARLPVS